MELSAIIRKLCREREKLDELIGSLEQAEASAAAKAARIKVKKRRGRTSMGAAERQQVSERLKRYWAQRRAGEQR